jgi:hypothetical protein
MLSMWRLHLRTKHNKVSAAQWQHNKKALLQMNLAEISAVTLEARICNSDCRVVD